MAEPARWEGEEQPVRVLAEPVILEGDLSLPKGARGVVLFAHGSGSSRHSPRNRLVASLLNEAKLATLLVDLLTPREEAIDLQTAHLRFDIPLLAKRLVGATDWLARHPDTRALRFGYFGASTGAAAALVAAAERPQQIDAVVSRGGRPDLAGTALDRVLAPTLLIAGGNDYPVIQMNQTAPLFTDPWRTSPAAKIPGTLDSSQNGSRSRGQLCRAGIWPCDRVRSAPVMTKP